VTNEAWDQKNIDNCQIFSQTGILKKIDPKWMKPFIERAFDRFRYLTRQAEGIISAFTTGGNIDRTSVTLL